MCVAGTVTRLKNYASGESWYAESFFNRKARKVEAQRNAEKLTLRPFALPLRALLCG